MCLCIVGPYCLHVCILLKQYCLCPIDRHNPNVWYDQQYNQVTRCSCHHSTSLTSTVTIIKQRQLLLWGSPAPRGVSLLATPSRSIVVHAGCKCRLSPAAAKCHTDSVLLETFQTAPALCSLPSQCHSSASFMAQA